MLGREITCMPFNVSFLLAISEVLGDCTSVSSSYLSVKWADNNDIFLIRTVVMMMQVKIYQVLILAIDTQCLGLAKRKKKKRLTVL